MHTQYTKVFCCEVFKNGFYILFYIANRTLLCSFLQKQSAIYQKLKYDEMMAVKLGSATNAQMI